MTEQQKRQLAEWWEDETPEEAQALDAMYDEISNKHYKHLQPESDCVTVSDFMFVNSNGQHLEQLIQYDKDTITISAVLVLDRHKASSTDNLIKKSIEKMESPLALVLKEHDKLRRTDVIEGKIAQSDYEDLKNIK